MKSSDEVPVETGNLKIVKKFYWTIKKMQVHGGGNCLTNISVRVLLNMKPILHSTAHCLRLCWISIDFSVFSALAFFW